MWYSQANGRFFVKEISGVDLCFNFQPASCRLQLTKETNVTFTEVNRSLRWLHWHPGVLPGKLLNPMLDAFLWMLALVPLLPLPRKVSNPITDGILLLIAGSDFIGTSETEYIYLNYQKYQLGFLLLLSSSQKMVKFRNCSFGS